MKKQLSVLVLLISLLGIGVCANEYISENTKPVSEISATTTAPPAKTSPTTTTPAATTAPVKTQSAQIVSLVNPIDVVKKPNTYLNKKICVTARFDKFATLGLDYKPAFRSSETYISFLILRTDTDKNIPLSEMKLFIKRTAAEKLIELKEGDKVQFSGTVFSTALGDPWVDVEKLEKVK